MTAYQEIAGLASGGGPSVFVVYGAGVAGAHEAADRLQSLWRCR
jgi:hypothetical protein